jgi:hypothetical protein
LRVEGTTSGLQDGGSWIVYYVLDLDESWRTRAASVSSRTMFGNASVELESDGDGHWLIDGNASPELDGCLDVDLESSALTNALPIHRLRMEVGQKSMAPAVYVRASTVQVERLEQTYLRTSDVEGCQQFDYEAPAFDFRCRLVYDHSGLVLDYPGIAARSS